MLFLIVPTSVQGQQFGGLDKTFVPAFITPEMASITFSKPKLMLLRGKFGSLKLTRSAPELLIR